MTNDEQQKPDRTTVLRITIDRPVGEIDRERIGLSTVPSEEGVAQSRVDPVQLGLLRMVDEMLAAYRR